MPISDFIERLGTTYTIHRDSFRDQVSLGLSNTDQDGRKYIGFNNCVDIQPGDIAENPNGNRFFIVEVIPQYKGKDVLQIRAFYETEYDRSRNALQASSVFNIQSVNGSIIGNSNSGSVNNASTIAEMRKQACNDTSIDKEDLEKIISALEMIVNDKIEPKKGLLSKFADVISRHPWLLESGGKLLFTWLSSRIVG